LHSKLVNDGPAKLKKCQNQIGVCLDGFCFIIIRKCTLFLKNNDVNPSKFFLHERLNYDSELSTEKPYTITIHYVTITHSLLGITMTLASTVC
jgi:hypothetical protein